MDWEVQCHVDVHTLGVAYTYQEDLYDQGVSAGAHGIASPQIARAFHNAWENESYSETSTRWLSWLHLSSMATPSGEPRAKAAFSVPMLSTTTCGDESVCGTIHRVYGAGTKRRRL